MGSRLARMLDCGLRLLDSHAGHLDGSKLLLFLMYWKGATCMSPYNGTISSCCNKNKACHRTAAQSPVSATQTRHVTVQRHNLQLLQHKQGMSPYRGTSPVAATQTRHVTVQRHKISICCNTNKACHRTAAQSPVAATQIRHVTVQRHNLQLLQHKPDMSPYSGTISSCCNTNKACHRTNAQNL